MAFASGINRTLVISKESVWGTKPAANTGTLFPRKTIELNLSRAAFESARINTSAQTEDMRSGTDEVSGTFAEELSAGSHTMLWAALLRGPWVAGVTYTAATISAASTTNKISRTSGSWLTSGYRIGDLVKVSGFTTTSNNGRFIVTAVTASDLTVDATLTTEAAGASVTVAVAGEKLVTPLTPALRTDDSFTIEQWQNDIGKGRLATGVKVTQAAIKIAPDAMGTVDFSLMGKDMVSESTQYFTNPAAQADNSILAGNRGTIYINGVAAAVVTAFDATVNANAEIGKTVGNLTAQGTRPAAAIFLGKLGVTGTLSLYWLDEAIFASFRDDIPVNIVLRSLGDNNKELIIKVTQARLSSATINDTATGGLVQTCNFTAIRDATPPDGIEDTTIVIQEILA